MKTTIKLAITDDQHLFRQGLMALIKDYPEIEVVIEASNGTELLEKLRNTNAEVVLLDLEMPIMDGYKTTEKLKARFPDVKILILTMHNEEELINHLISKGANGFLMKNQDIKTIIDSVHGVVDNGYYFNDKVSRSMVTELIKTEKIQPTFDPVVLSEREIEIIKLVSREYTNRQIADLLSLSVRTVEGHRERIIEKTNSKNVVGMIMYAFKNKLLD